MNPDGTIPDNAKDTGLKCVTVAPGGNCTIDGLRFSDFAEGKQLNPGDARYNYYWLVETKAPSGYELLAQAILFELKGADADANYVFPDLKVENVESGGGFELPFTGGPGTILFVVAGVLLLSGTAAMVASRSRKANQG